MRVSLESIGALERRLEVTVPAEHIEQAISARLKTFSRTAQLKGFRPGKAPLAVVKRQFGPQIRDEVVSDIVRDSLGSALNEHRLSPVANPRIEPLPATSGEGLRYSAVFEVYPEIKIQGLEAMEVERPAAEVGSADVDAMLETLRKQRPNYVPATRPAAEGDRLMVDFEGRLDGIAFEGGTGTGISVILGAGRMLKDFEAGLLGISVGETRVVPVAFPADYGKAELAGRTAEFSITATQHDEVELPVIDAEFCSAFGVAEGGVEQLRREVEENMRRELAENIRNRVKGQLIEKLLAANPIDLPRAAVDDQIRMLQVDWLRRIGANPQDLKEAPPREPFEEGARRRVALGLLIGEIIRNQGISVDAARLEERIESAVVGYADPEAAIRQIRADESMRGQLEGGVLEDQAFDWLISQVKTVDVPSTFKELMNFGA